MHKMVIQMTYVSQRDMLWLSSWSTIALYDKSSINQDYGGFWLDDVI